MIQLTSDARGLANPCALARQLARDLACARDLARDLALDLDFVRYLVRDRLLDFDFVGVRALDLNLIRDLLVDLVHAHDVVCDVVGDLDVIGDLNLVRARARDVIGDLDLGLVRDLDITGGLERALSRARDLDRALSDLDHATRRARAVVAGGVRITPGRVSRGLVAVAVRALPVAQRGRYRAEFYSELVELPRRKRLGHARRVLVWAWELRQALREAMHTPEGDVARRAER